MSSLAPLGFSFRGRSFPPNDHTEHVIVQHPLHQILAFTRRSIDQVVNDPIAKNEVIGYYKLHRRIHRHCEAVDLDRWWNGEQK